MPLEVIDATHPEWAAGRPTNAASLRMMLENALDHDSSLVLFPTLSAVGMPNPSSQLPGSPCRNILSGNRDERWIAPGTYIISSETAKGYEFATSLGNYELRIDQGGPSTDVEARTTTPTTFYSGRSGRLAMMAKLTAGANAAGHTGTYTVTYSEATGKFTIANSSTNFTMTGKPTHSRSILASMGFPAASYSGASTYTSANPAWHTEDWFVGRLANQIDPIYLPAEVIGSRAITSKYRYIALVDCNYPFNANGYMKLFFATTTGALDDTPDSSFTEYVDFYQFAGDQIEDQQIDPYVQNDAASMGLRRIGEWGVTAKARHYLIDFAGLRMDAAYGNQATEPSYAFMKFKVSCPQSPSFDFRLGHLRVSTGWWPRRNVLDGVVLRPEDLSSFSTSTRGKHRSSTRGTARRFTAEFGARNPLSFADAEILSAFLAGGFSQGATGGEYHRNPTAGGKTTGAIAWLPSQSSQIPNIRGVMFGRAALRALRVTHGSRYLGSIDFEEEAIG